MRKTPSFFDLLFILGPKRRFIFFSTLFCCAVAIVYICIAPLVYKAECRILPPSKTGGALGTAMMAQMGGLASLIGMETSTKGELLIGILQGDTIVDKIIDRFSLMTLYNENLRVRMRRIVKEDILNATEDVKSGIVTIAALDENPVRAAEIANAFVEFLQMQMKSLAVGEAAQRRLFFEEQVRQAFQVLGNAEDEMLKYQQKSGMIAMEPQIEAVLTSIATLRAQIAAKEVEISALRTYARKENPNLKLAQSQLAAMRAELGKLEKEQNQEREGQEQVADMFPSIKQAPSLGLEYQRHLREVKFAATLYELMLKQLEAAKLDESHEAMQIQILDPATPPDYKFKPKRAAIIVFSTLFGFSLAVLLSVFLHAFNSWKDDQQ